MNNKKVEVRMRVMQDDGSLGKVQVIKRSCNYMYVNSRNNSNISDVQFEYREERGNKVKSSDEMIKGLVISHKSERIEKLNKPGNSNTDTCQPMSSG